MVLSRPAGRGFGFLLLVFCCLFSVSALTFSSPLICRPAVGFVGLGLDSFPGFEDCRWRRWGGVEKKKQKSKKDLYLDFSVVVVVVLFRESSLQLSRFTSLSG